MLQVSVYNARGCYDPIEFADHSRSFINSIRFSFSLLMVLSIAAASRRLIGFTDRTDRHRSLHRSFDSAAIPPLAFFSTRQWYSSRCLSLPWNLCSIISTFQSMPTWRTAFRVTFRFFSLSRSYLMQIRSCDCCEETKEEKSKCKSVTVCVYSRSKENFEWIVIKRRETKKLW